MTTSTLSTLHNERREPILGDTVAMTGTLRRGLLVFLALLGVAMILQRDVRGENWPGWRGDGSGVSRSDNLPLEWDNENGVLWKTRIEGEGISSPITWDDKIFVSTAVEGNEGGALNYILASALLALAGIIVVSGIIALRGYFMTRKERPDLAGSPLFLRIASIGEKIGAVTLIIFFAFGCLRLVQHLLLGTEFFPEGHRYHMPEGIMHIAWQKSGNFFAAGIVGAIGLTRFNSRWRLLAALALFALAVSYWQVAPRDEYTRALPLSWWGKVLGLLTVAGCWYLVTYFAGRLFCGKQVSVAGGGGARTVCVLSLLAGSTLFFTYINYLSPQGGLWRSVVCLDGNNGKTLWRKDAFPAPSGRKYRKNSYATPTPATDGEVVVAHFGPGIVCMDMDGKVKWKKMEPLYEKYLRYGAASGPVIVGDRVIYPFMAENPEAGDQDDSFSFKKHSYLAAVEKHTGEELWRVCPPEAHDSYNTPFVLSRPGYQAIVMSTYDHAIAYDVATGEELWRVNIPMSQPVPSIIADEETVYLTGGIHGPSVAAAIGLGGRGDITTTHIKWQLTKGINTCSSPVVFDGLLYWVTEGGILNCIDTETGKHIYRKRLPGGDYLSSIAAGDGKIYVPNTKGDVHVIKAGPSFEILASNSVGEECYTYPVLGEGRVLLRCKENLFCISGERGSREAQGLSAGSE